MKIAEQVELMRMALEITKSSYSRVDIQTVIETYQKLKLAL